MRLLYRDLTIETCESDGSSPCWRVADVVVCTVGEMRLFPGASNVIARSAEFSLDIRSESDDIRAGAPSLKCACEFRPKGRRR